MHGRDVDAMEAELFPETEEAKRVRGPTACDFPRTQVCDESRGIIGVVARVGFSDVAKGDEGKTTGRSSSTPWQHYLIFEALPHATRVRDDLIAK